MKNKLQLKIALAISGMTILSTSAFAQSGNYGIGTATPGTKLDVAGAITNRETSVAVAANAATVPANTSQVQLTGAATATVAITAPAAPNAGQRLIIYNNTTGGFGATLNGFTVLNGQAMEFAYSNGGWRATNNGYSGGAGTVDADNGLTVGYNSAGKVGLGGTLGKNTDVALNSKALTFSGAAINAGQNQIGMGVSSLSIGNQRLEVSASATDNPAIRLSTGGTKNADLVPFMAAGAYNPITSLGDQGWIFSKTDGTQVQSASASGSRGVVIAPWTNSLTAVGLKVAENGNIGIGTSSPSTAVDVVQQNLVQPSGTDIGPRLTLRTSGGSGGGISFGNTNHGIQRGFPAQGMDNNVGFYTTSGNLYLGTNGQTTGEFVLADNGNVGIGTTTPNSKLEINSGSSGSSGVRFTQMNSSSAAATAVTKTLGVNASGDVVVVGASGAVNYTGSYSSGMGLQTGSGSGYSAGWGTLNWSQITNTGQFNGNTFTAPSDGYYMVSLTVGGNWDGTASSGFMYGQIVHQNSNGSTIRSYPASSYGSDGQVANNEQFSLTISPVIYMTTGQRIITQAYTASNSNTSPGSFFGTLSVIKF